MFSFGIIHCEKKLLLKAGGLLNQTHQSSTYHKLLCYIPALLQLVQDLVRYMLVHFQMERDWCRFLNVSELLHHKSHCIRPTETNQCSHRARLKASKKPINVLLRFFNYSLRRTYILNFLHQLTTTYGIHDHLLRYLAAK